MLSEATNSSLSRPAKGVKNADGPLPAREASSPPSPRLRRSRICSAPHNARKSNLASTNSKPEPCHYTETETRKFAALVGYLALLPVDQWQWWKALVTGRRYFGRADSYELNRVGRISFIVDEVFRLTPSQLKLGWEALKRISQDSWRVQQEIKKAKESWAKPVRRQDPRRQARVACGRRHSPRNPQGPQSHESRGVGQFPAVESPETLATPEANEPALAIVG